MWLPHPRLLKPKKRRNGRANRTFSGFPNKGDKIRSGYRNPAFSGAQKRTKLLCNNSALNGPRQRGQNRKRLPYHRLVGGPKEGVFKTQPLDA